MTPNPRHDPSSSSRSINADKPDSPADGKQNAVTHIFARVLWAGIATGEKKSSPFAGRSYTYSIVERGRWSEERGGGNLGMPKRQQIAKQILFSSNSHISIPAGSAPPNPPLAFSHSRERRRRRRGKHSLHIKLSSSSHPPRKRSPALKKKKNFPPHPPPKNQPNSLPPHLPTPKKGSTREPKPTPLQPPQPLTGRHIPPPIRISKILQQAPNLPDLATLNPLRKIPDWRVLAIQWEVSWGRSWKRDNKTPEESGKQSAGKENIMPVRQRWRRDSPRVEGDEGSEEEEGVVRGGRGVGGAVGEEVAEEVEGGDEGFFFEEGEGGGGRGENRGKEGREEEFRGVVEDDVCGETEEVFDDVGERCRWLWWWIGRRLG
ncbi:hypothetical protein KC338_g6 [Hortaea werneckii]|nr:hypothetical protein KC338_g6 [Hortaea werneckii]